MTVTRAQLEKRINELRRQIDNPEGGIYGPGSQAWQTGKEGILFLGGGRAALLQLAHPYVAYGVEHHSKTKTDPLGRFQRTFDNVLAMIFGDLDDAIRCARRVYAVHTRITGRIPQRVGALPSGARYEANDEAALFWVHATLIDTAVQVYDLCIRPLTYYEKNRYYVESKRFAALFGIPDSVMPSDWSAFSEYNRKMWNSELLTVGPAARDLRRFLFASPKSTHKPLFKWLEIMTAGFMPERLRNQFELDFNPKQKRVFDASLTALRRTVPRLPKRLRYIPAYIRAQRRLKGRTGPDRIGDWLEQMTLKGINARRAPNPSKGKRSKIFLSK